MKDVETFDKDVLRQLISELGPEDTAEVLRAFVDDTNRKIAVLDTACPDPVLVRQEAHSIKSSAGTFGFLTLSMLASEVEQYALCMSPEQLKKATLSLRKIIEETVDFARSVLLAANMEIE
jgi:HPt (histidine-containing phosphotransfer) domain-containing protein